MYLCCCVQVPKPKWENRCPPERCYQADHAFAFDMYMAGIIIVCIATGIDFPHLGTPVSSLTAPMPGAVAVAAVTGPAGVLTHGTVHRQSTRLW